jgi:hypothetical protein
MIIKNADDKTEQLSELERLLNIAPSILKGKIQQELRILRAGMKGEQEAAYLIDFDLRDSRNTCVIHDLRLEFKDRVAQIDHLLIHRSMKVYLVETKHFHAGIKVTETGEFMIWDAFRKHYVGMPSPFAQNERHITVLKDVFSALIDLPRRLGIKLEPEFRSIVAVAPSARIERPRNFDTSNLVKADLIIKKLDEELLAANTLTAVAKLVSTDTIRDIAQQLIRLHRPIQFNYAAKFGLEDSPAKARKINAEPMAAPTMDAAEKTNTTQAPVADKSLACRKCNSTNISIQYGKFGYYFKCADCDGNTPINIGCGKDGHKERIRKAGLKFFRECADCRTSSLYFENKG